MKRIVVRVYPGSQQNSVRESEPGVFIVRTTAAAEDDKANKSTLKLLAKHLDVPISSVSLYRGSRSRDKVIDIVLG